MNKNSGKSVLVDVRIETLYSCTLQSSQSRKGNDVGKRTPFYEMHVASHGKIVDFAGWDMPLHYGSQLKEHSQVRTAVGMFDVSHMGVVDIKGEAAKAYLSYLLANNINRLTVGKALYTCMLNEQGGVLDDLIVYQLAENSFRMVINAGRREQDLAWIKHQAEKFNATIIPRDDLAMLAVQGPLAVEKMGQLFPDHAHDITHLKPFNFLSFDHWFIARTGYTGEDGFEIIFPATEAASLWQKCMQIEIFPCGLGARDTLRLEAGLNLYGSDMDEHVSPYESNLGWTVALEPVERAFIGRSVMEQKKQNGVDRILIGLVLEGPGIIRNHQKVIFENAPEGEVTSGGYSPSLQKSIALARIPKTELQECWVEIRNKPVKARIVKPPFLKQGKKLI